MAICPAAGDLIVSFDAQQHASWILESGSNDVISGPYARDSYAIGAAHALAASRRVSVWLRRDGVIALLDDVMLA